MSTEIVKLKSPVTVLRELKKKYLAENIKKYHVYRAVKRFEETGSVTDGRHRNSGQAKSVRSAKTLLKWDKWSRNATNVSKKNSR